MIPEFSDGFFTINARYGFLPIKDPLETLPSRYHSLQTLLTHLSSHIQTLSIDEFGRIVESLPDYLPLIQQESDVFVQAALYRGYCFVASAYLLHPSHVSFLKEQTYGQARSHLPVSLSGPLIYLADCLNVFPWLEYSFGYSLGNYVRIDKTGSLDVENLVMANRFTGTADEIGFIMVHVDINQHTPDLIRHCDAILEKQALGENPYQDLEQTVLVLQRMNASRRKMWNASRWKHYNDFRVFIMGIQGNTKIFPNGVYYGDEKEPRYYRGQSGSQDSIIPFLDSFFRVCDYYPTNELTEYLYDMRRYRPKPFRDLLEWTRDATQDLVSWILSFPGNDEILFDIYQEIYHFRNGHWQFVQKYIMKNTSYPIATGGTPIISWIPNQITATIEAIKPTAVLHSHLQSRVLEMETLLHQQCQMLTQGRDIYDSNTDKDEEK